MQLTKTTVPKRVEEKTSNIPLRVGQVEHIIRKEVEATSDNVPIISLLMKRIQLLEQRFDNSVLIQQATVSDRHEDHTDEDFEVYLSDNGEQNTGNRRLNQQVTHSDTTMSDMDDEEYLPIAKPNRRRSKSVQLPVTRRKALKTVQPKPKPRQRKEIDRCPHCADVMTKGHKCWVLDKQIKCFKCGGPNHIAVACRRKGFGMQMDVLNKMNQTQIQKEISRLNRLLALKRYPKTNQDVPLRGHVVRRQTQSEPEAVDLTEPDSPLQMTENEPFLSIRPQLYLYTVFVGGLSICNACTFLGSGRNPCSSMI